MLSKNLIRILRLQKLGNIIPIRITIDEEEIQIDKQKREDLQKILICFVNQLNVDEEKKDWKNFVINGHR